MTLLSLWGRNPAGYLAGLGLTVVCPEATLTWSNRDEFAITSLDERELLDVVLGDAARCRDATSLMVRNAEQVVAAAIAQCQPDVGAGGTNPELAGAPGVRREKARRKRELAAWANSMSRPRLGLDLTSGQQDFGSAGATLADALSSADVGELIVGDALPLEPYGRELRGAHLRLSHDDGRPYAYCATAPGRTPPRVRVAASWLAWRAIVAHPLLGSRYASPPHVLPWPDLALVWSLGGPLTYRSRITRDRYGYGSLSPAEAMVRPRPPPPRDGWRVLVLSRDDGPVVGPIRYGTYDADLLASEASDVRARWPELFRGAADHVEVEHLTGEQIAYEDQSRRRAEAMHREIDELARPGR